MRLRRALLIVLLGAAAGALLARLRPWSGTGSVPASRTRQEQPPAGPPVVFAPAPGGFHTAWLVAGPFGKPLAAPGSLSEPVEGRPAGRDGAGGGGRWRLCTGAGGAGGGPGVYYHAGSLESEGGPRRIIIQSSGPARAWLNGRPLGRAGQDPLLGNWDATFDAELRPGGNRLLVEVDASGGPAGPRLGLMIRRGEAPAPERVALRLADASRRRLLQLLARALELDSEGVWTEPGRRIAAKLARVGSAPEVGGEVALEVCLSKGRPEAAVTAAIPVAGAPRLLPAAGLLRQAVDLSLTAPEGDYLWLELEASLAGTAGAEPLRRFSRSFYAGAGMLDAARKLAADARAVEASRPGSDGALLAGLKAEKALLMLAGLEPGAGSGEGAGTWQYWRPGEAEARAALEEISAGAEALDAARRGRDPLAGRTGWLERAYRCATDGSLQPYRLYVPRRLADPSERQRSRAPLLVYLHGYVPGYDKHFWVEEQSLAGLCAAAEQTGAVLLVPFGRSNTDFVSIGEVDVLRAMDESCRRYPVDRGRVYLLGYSMGGYGAYALAAHFPDRFAGLLSMDGRPVPYYLDHQVQLSGRLDLPAYKQFCLNLDNPFLLTPNLIYVPAHIYHATSDSLVLPEWSRLMARAVRESGGDAFLHEFDGDHWSGFEALTRPETLELLLAGRRPARPSGTVVRTFSPRFGRAWWLEISAIDRWTEPAQLAAMDDGGGAVRVRAENVRAFVLRDISGPRAAVSGAEAYDLVSVRGAAGRWSVSGRLKSAPRPGRWAKTAELSGPMREACNTPFTVVWGSAGAEDRTAANRAGALRFAEEWHGFARGRPPVRDEAELSAADKAGRSIILFGSPESSRLLRQAAPTLECRISEDRFEVAGRRAMLGAGRGLVLTRPSPWAPGNDRYLVVCMGRFYGEGLSVNHKLDLVPDFVVFGPGSEGEGEPPAVLAGFFDSDWRADPELVEVFPPRP